MNKESFKAFLIAAVMGSAIWLLSPMFTGYEEPWDAESIYYLISSLIVGLVSGALFQKHIAAVVLGIVIGQIIFIVIFLQLGPLFLIGFVHLLGYGVVSFFGVLLAVGARLVLTND